MRKGNFTTSLTRASQERSSRIILALDLTASKIEDLLSMSMTILEETSPAICAVKMNHHILLRLNLFNETARLVEKAHDLGLQVLADLKLGDISSTNLVASSYLWQADFDCIIVNPLSGYQGGLDSLLEGARRLGKGVLGLSYMSHPGAKEVYDLLVNLGDGMPPVPLYEILLRRCLSWKFDGVVVAATNLQVIRRAREILSEGTPIFSPGIGAQGGDASEALKCGADYLFVGRSITQAPHPGAAAERIRAEAQGAS